MIDATYTYPYRQSLVHTLISQGVLHSPDLTHAFLKVPREAFLSWYYEQEGHTLSWKQMAAPASDVSSSQRDQWYQTIYRDRALVTHLDARGMPISSSSMPSVVATMIETLSIERGHRLLEIGAGTGYNAALLASLVGNHALTTIDIDPALTLLARQRLEHLMGSGIRVRTENGIALHAQGCYDRIIATGSWPRVPPAWISALAPAGRLIMDVRGDLAGGLVLFEKVGEDTVVGSFLPRGSGTFMPLRVHLESSVLPSLMVDGPLIEDIHISANTFSPDQLYQTDVALWLHCHLPHLHVRRQYTLETHAVHLSLIDPDHQTTTVIQPDERGSGWHITTYGTYPLWSQIDQLMREWDNAQCPARDRYRLHATIHGALTITVTT